MPPSYPGELATIHAGPRLVVARKNVGEFDLVRRNTRFAPGWLKEKHHLCFRKEFAGRLKLCLVAHKYRWMQLVAEEPSDRNRLWKVVRLCIGHAVGESAYRAVAVKPLLPRCNDAVFMANVRARCADQRDADQQRPQSKLKPAAFWHVGRTLSLFCDSRRSPAWRRRQLHLTVDFGVWQRSLKTGDAHVGDWRAIQIETF